ncbi:MAG: cytidine deaminase [Planctomycetaceae bacterium]|nr:cytidine deaminase [Planctomycetaceae bacterium]
MSSDLSDPLCQAALEARSQAHAPYSQFMVGAAIQTASGHISPGCNLENRSYGLTNCAERVALGNAVAAGHRDFQAIAIASSGGVLPCGACRQVLLEFCPQLTIFLIDVDKQVDDAGYVRIVELADLLPGGPTP